MGESSKKLTLLNKVVLYFSIIILSPLGIWLIWKWKPWEKKYLKIVTGIAVVWFILVLNWLSISGKEEKNNVNTNSSKNSEDKIVKAKKTQKNKKIKKTQNLTKIKNKDRSDNLIIFVNIFNDEDCDEWDTGGIPDPSISIMFNGKKYKLPERENTDNTFFKTEIIVKKNNIYDMKIYDEDPDSKRELIGSAKGKFKGGKPVLINAGWAIVIFSKESELKKSLNRKLYQDGIKRIREKRLKIWKKHIVKKWKYSDFKNSSIRVKKANIYSGWKNPYPQDRMYCPYSIVKPENGDDWLFVELDEKNNTNTLAKMNGFTPLFAKGIGLKRDRKDWIQYPRVVSLDGRKFYVYSDRKDGQLKILQNCIFREKYQLGFKGFLSGDKYYTEIGTGKKGKFKLFYRIPKNINKKDLYLEIRGKSKGNGIPNFYPLKQIYVKLF